MSEKKRFKLNGAVVNSNAMELPMAEKCVDLAHAALREHYTEKVGPGRWRVRNWSTRFLGVCAPFW